VAKSITFSEFTHFLVVYSGQNQKLEPENPGSSLIVCTHYFIISSIMVSKHA